MESKLADGVYEYREPNPKLTLDQKQMIIFSLGYAVGKGPVIEAPARRVADLLIKFDIELVPLKAEGN